MTSRFFTPAALVVAAMLVCVAGPFQSVHAQANPNQGPGGPILVVTSGTTNFGRYYAEILRTEGFNSFAVADIGSVNSTLLSNYDVVLLAKVPVNSSQATALANWVNNGGNLIVMDPAASLHGLAGLSSTGQTLSEGYLRIDTSNPIGSGIVGETMQFHGTATRFNVTDASVLATLYSTSTTATPNPAVTLRSVGMNGGQVATFAFDLATSIVYMRQGNPAWAGQERTNDSGIRSDDLFTGIPSVDQRQFWFDPQKIAIPQADEQQRFLANLITHMNLDRKPLPRFWYFPRGLKAVVIMTGDDHARGHQGWGATEARFNQHLAYSPAGCSVQNWECVRSTSYLVLTTDLTNAAAAAFEAQGFEFGVHIRLGEGDSMACINYTQSTLNQAYTNQLAEFMARFPSLSAQKTERHHCVLWSDWASGAKVQQAHGVRLDTNYYWSGAWTPFGPGHFTGSAMPMRFADLDGTLIDVYQAVTQLNDEANQQYPFVINTLLDRALGEEEHYGVYTVNAHIDEPTVPESDTVIEAALARGVPVIAAKQMLQWLDARNASSFGAMNWSDNTLTFTVNPNAGAFGLRAMVPRRSSNFGTLSTLRRNGVDVPFEVISVKGVEYASFAAAAGSYTATYAADTTPPVISGRTPAPGATGVALTTSIEVAFSEPIDPATVNASTFELKAATGAVVPVSITYNASTFTVRLSPSMPLMPAIAYTVTVRGGTQDPRVKDMAGNALASSSSWSFTTGGDSCPCTLWTASAAPALYANDGEGVNLGVKFRSDHPGYVTGVRFYKAPGSTGTHIGYLWTETGQLLASVTFSGETANGWQQANFPSPVPIAANTTYIIAYYTPDGRFGLNPAYFSGGGVDRNMLHAPMDGGGGGNGVFAYGSPGLFPDGSWNASNYWVDVVFALTAPQGQVDNVPPQITIQSPTTASTYVTSSPQVSLLGSASDNVGVTMVTWTSDRGGSGTASGTNAWTISGITLQPGANVLTVTARDAAGNTGTDTLTVTYNVPPADTTPPTITARTPAAGASDVPLNASVSITFSEPMNAATINTASVELRTASNAVVPAQVSYSGTVATLTPQNSLEYGATYTVIVHGGATGSRVQDLAGNALASDVSWSFTTIAPPVFTGSIWGSATPAIAAADDPDSVELGVKFRSDVSGYITGIRFYKGPGNTGTHVGNLWTADGQLLASAVFVNETATGWQEVSFATPVAIEANKVYVASYFAPNGRFALTMNYFAIAGFDNGVLHALSGPASGGNGVFIYGSSSQFPIHSWSNANYWVDVMFTNDGTPEPPTTPEPPPPPVVTDTIWPASATPSVAAAADTDSVELGVKFVSAVDGYITGIRFYKGPGNTGTHVGKLWTASGQLLASVVFTNETATGWQQANFDTPVPIQANTVYVASYYAPNGRFAIDPYYFSWGGAGDGVVRALADGEFGGNGVFAYGNGNLFPSGSWGASNYWVDVVFTTSP